MEKKRRLVVSWDSYSWVHEIAGLISRYPKSFDVIVVTDDSSKQIHWCPQLCEDAVYAQRKYDLFQIGTRLGVKSLSSFLLKEDDIEELAAKLTAKLQMHIFLNRPQEVYFQHNAILNSIFGALLRKMDMDCFSFGSYTDLCITEKLTEEEHDRKTELLSCMVGLPYYKLEYSKKEYILKVGA